MLFSVSRARTARGGFQHAALTIGSGLRAGIRILKRKNPCKGSEAPSVDYIEMDPETATAAAIFALSKKSRHHTCSEACSGGELHTLIAHE